MALANTTKSYLYQGGGILLLATVGCMTNVQEESLFELLDPSQTGIAFNNRIEEDDSINIVNNYDIYNGGGIGIADFDNDGQKDIFFAGNLVTSRLYLNRGEWNFEDVTEQAGVQTEQWINSVSPVDINADGWTDIYLSSGVYCQADCQNILFQNDGLQDGKLHFTRIPGCYGLSDPGFTTNTAFLDYDLDGDLDAFLIKNRVDRFSKVIAASKNSSAIKGKTRDILYRNDGLDDRGRPKFTDVSLAAGIISDGWSLGVVVDDINADGWPDIYVSNDFFSEDLLYLNQGDGTFRESVKTYLAHSSENGMGVDMGDINNDLTPGDCCSGYATGRQPGAEVNVAADELSAVRPAEFTGLPASIFEKHPATS